MEAPSERPGYLRGLRPESGIRYHRAGKLPSRSLADDCRRRNDLDSIQSDLCKKSVVCIGQMDYNHAMITIEFDPSVEERLKQLATARGQDPSQLAQRVIEEYLD